MATIRSLLSDGSGGFATAAPWNCVCALALIVLFAPLILGVYLLVKAGGAPALVRDVQLRRDGTAVCTWRFRTCRFRAKLPEGGWHGQEDASISEDPRPEADQATALGRFLLRTRIDSLPLLYNVVKGELTLSEMMQDA